MDSDDIAREMEKVDALMGGPPSHYDHPPEADPAKCEATTHTGRRCKNYRYRDDPLCEVHRKYSGTSMERFWDKVEKGADCWLWTGATRGQMGYGSFKHNGKMVSAHRLAYTEHHGAIPKGRELRHVCEVPRCVNPEHLVLLPERRNTVEDFWPKVEIAGDD